MLDVTLMSTNDSSDSFTVLNEVQTHTSFRHKSLYAAWTAHMVNMNELQRGKSAHNSPNKNLFTPVKNSKIAAFVILKLHKW